MDGKAEGHARRGMKAVNFYALPGRSRSADRLVRGPLRAVPCCSCRRPVRNLDLAALSVVTMMSLVGLAQLGFETSVAAFRRAKC